MQILKAFSKRVMFNLFKTKNSIPIAIMCVVALNSCGTTNICNCLVLEKTTIAYDTNSRSKGCIYQLATQDVNSPYKMRTELYFPLS